MTSTDIVESRWIEIESSVFDRYGLITVARGIGTVGWRVIWYMTCFGLLASGCGGGDHALLIRLMHPSGQPVTEARVVITGPDGNHALAVLGSKDKGENGAVFEEGGLLVDPAPSAVDFTVKVPGTVFETRGISVPGLPVEAGRSVYDWYLTALPPFEANDDFATGFDPGSGLDGLTSLSVGFPTELGPADVVKFTIHPVDQDPAVYLQDTKRHPLHYNFAHDVIGIPVTLAEFEKGTYHGEDRLAMAGTLLHYPGLKTTDQDGEALEAPVVVTWFPNDDLTPDQAMHAHRLLEERLLCLQQSGAINRLVYLPAGEAQEEQAVEASDDFRTRDVRWVSREALYGNLTLQLLNEGLAFGTLRLMTPEELAKTVVSFTDVLVLTRLPNSLPIVGGTITEELQTPLAHVNVAARNRGTPNIALVEASQDPRVKDLLGKLVRFEVKGGEFDLREATIEEAQAFWDGHAPDPVTLDFDVEFEGLPGFADIGFPDSVRVGAKAANLAEMTHVISDNTPTGFAVPFRYYDEFMQSAFVTPGLCDEAQADCVEEGRYPLACDAVRNLCLPDGAVQEVMWDHVTRLMLDETFRSDTTVREACLDAVRYHMHHIPVDGDFGEALNARVAEVFADVKVRLRSSTNAEDLPNFSGAGLYRSISAYASGNKIASDRVRKVWASAWNWTAFEERSFWGIEHLSVRVGVAVNQAFPDEAANGVLITQNIADPTVAGMYVNVQLGEVSVTNPEGGALPEVISIVPGPEGIQVARQRFSSLSPGVPILTHDEVFRLFQTAYKVQDHFAPLYGQSPYALALDMEFKFHGPERAMFVKQVRPYTQGSAP